MTQQFQHILFMSCLAGLMSCATHEISGGDCPDPEPFDVNLTLTEEDVQSVLGESLMAGDPISNEKCDDLCRAHIEPEGKSIRIENCDTAWFEGDDDVSGLSFSCDGTLALMCL